MRRILYFSALISGLSLCTASASACINDREVGNAEREFKSNYLEKPASPVLPGETGPSEQGGPVAMGTGGVLLAAALMLGLARTGNSQRRS